MKKKFRKRRYFSYQWTLYIKSYRK